MKLVKTRYDMDGRVTVELVIFDGELQKITSDVRLFSVARARFDELSRILGNNVDKNGVISEQLFALAALAEMIENPEARKRPIPQRGYLP